MTEDRLNLHYKNTIYEWDYELSINPYYSVEDHKDWCAENNYGVNNSG